MERTWANGEKRRENPRDTPQVPEGTVADFLRWLVNYLRNGGGPFVLRPELCDEKLTTGKTGSILCLRSGYKINSFLAIQTLPVFPVVIFSAPA